MVGNNEEQMLFKVTVVVGVPYEGNIVVEAPDATAAQRLARELFSREGFHPDTAFEEYGDERAIDTMNRLGWFEQADEAVPVVDADEQAIANGDLFISGTEESDAKMKELRRRQDRRHRRRV